MAKFLPQGSLKMQLQPVGDEVISYTVPQQLTIRFSVTQKNLSSTQTAQFRVYGLNDITRDAIFKDAFAYTTQRSIQFSAGYPGFTPQIFDGIILSAYSDKEGNTDTVTVIEAIGGGFAITNGFTSTTIPAGTSANQVISALGGDLPGIVSAPVVGSFPSVNLRTEILVGNTWGIIQSKSQGQASIVDGRVVALNQNEALASNRVPLVSAQTGLIGVPRRSGNLVEFDMVFEPRLGLLQLVDIQSTFNPLVNGLHKVVGIEHRGAISTTHAVPNVTTGSFIWFGKDVTTSEQNAAIAIAAA